MGGAFGGGPFRGDVRLRCCCGVLGVDPVWLYPLIIPRAVLWLLFISLVLLEFLRNKKLEALCSFLALMLLFDDTAFVIDVVVVEVVVLFEDVLVVERDTVMLLKQRDNSAAARLVKLTSADIVSTVLW